MATARKKPAAKKAKKSAARTTRKPREKVGRELTPKQLGFVMAYIETGNASEAYRRAYQPWEMSTKAVNVEASRLLDHPIIALTIDNEREKLRQRCGVTAERVIKELAKIGFADMRNAVEWRSHLSKEEDNPEGGDVLVVQHSYSNHVNFKASDEIDDDTAGAIAEVSQGKDGALKVRLHSKVDALEKLGKHLGLFDKKGGDGEDGDKPVTVNVKVTGDFIREQIERRKAKGARNARA